jgi:hypothetical protein
MAPSRALVLYGDLAGVLRNVAVIMSCFLVVAQALLLFRLYSQLAGAQPQSAPGTWLYSLSGVLVAPFRGYETAPLPGGSTALEFALLVAIEGLLAFGLLVVLSAYHGSKLAATYQPNPWVGRYEIGPAVALWEQWDRRAEAIARTALSLAGNALRRIDAALTSEAANTGSAQRSIARTRLQDELSRAQPRSSLR